MNSYNLSWTFENIKLIVRMLLDIGIMWMLLYYAIKIVKNSSRTIQIFKGIILILMVDGVSKILGLSTVSWLAGLFVNWGFLAAIIVFQPEIRSVLEKIGKTSVFSKISSLSGNEKDHLVDAVVTASMLLSRNQTGALITLEQSQSLGDYINTGTKINSVVSAELLTSIFVTSTPLHDGAVIIQGDRIACASAYFPLTNAPVPSRYGTRHRAALGISELTDAVTIVISEETGSISVAENGKFMPVNRKELREYLTRVICGKGTEVILSEREPKIVAPVIVEREESQGSIDDEYVIEPKALPSAEKKEVKTETSVLNRLAIKRYDEEKVEEDTEIVSSADIVESSEPEETPKKRFGFFKKKKKKVKDTDIKHKEEQDRSLDQEKNIKLPRKKENMNPISFEMDKTAALPQVEDSSRQTRYSTTQNIRVMGDTGRLDQQEALSESRQYNTQSLSGEELRRARAAAIREGRSFSNLLQHPVHDTSKLETIKKIQPMEKRRGTKITMDFSDTTSAPIINTQSMSVVDDAIEIEGPHNQDAGGEKK